MNDRDYDIRLVEKTMKIDKMFEDFLKDKLGERNATEGNTAGEERQDAVGVQQGYNVGETPVGAD